MICVANAITSSAADYPDFATIIQIIYIFINEIRGICGCLDIWLQADETLLVDHAY